MSDVKQYKIAIIEDELELVDSLKQFLEPRGFEISAAYDGETGLRIVQETLPDIVLLDIMMPKLDGRDVLIRLKKDEKTKGIPVIIISAKDEIFEVEYGKELGAAAYLTKPCHITQLMKHINNILGLAL